MPVTVSGGAEPGHPAWTSPLTLQPIGYVRSPYVERYGTPRQPTVVSGTLGEVPQEAEIVLDRARIPVEALRGLEGFDYVWVVVWLHQNKGWRPMVTPTRGPRVKRGLFATRSPHRPCPIGLSALRLIGVEGHTLQVLGLDLLDGTPVLDVKPYVPYADAFPGARAGWLDALDTPIDGPDRPTKVPGRKRRVVREGADQ